MHPYSLVCRGKSTRNGWWHHLTSGLVSKKKGGNKILLEEMEILKREVNHGEDLKAKAMVNFQIHKEKRTLFVGRSKAIETIWGWFHKQDMVSQTRCGT